MCFMFIALQFVTRVRKSHCIVDVPSNILRLRLRPPGLPVGGERPAAQQPGFVAPPKLLLEPTRAAVRGRGGRRRG